MYTDYIDWGYSTVVHTQQMEPVLRFVELFQTSVKTAPTGLQITLPPSFELENERVWKKGTVEKLGKNSGEQEVPNKK